MNYRENLLTVLFLYFMFNLKELFILFKIEIIIGGNSK